MIYFYTKNLLDIDQWPSWPGPEGPVLFCSYSQADDNRILTDKPSQKQFLFLLFPILFFSLYFFALTDRQKVSIVVLIVHIHATILFDN